MTIREAYYTIEQTARTEFSERGSRFIALAFPMKSKDQLKDIIQSVKKEFPKASHYCFAYRVGVDGSQFRASDDGEPSGTAGRPILGQIDSKELTNLLIVVVRYFGGTLLGVPGLINAYKTAASLVLQVVPVLQRNVEKVYQMQFDYTMMNEVMTLIRQHQGTVLRQDLQLFCVVQAGIPVSREEAFLSRVSDFTAIECKVLAEPQL